MVYAPSTTVVHGHHPHRYFHHLVGFRFVIVLLLLLLLVITAVSTKGWYPLLEPHPQQRQRHGPHGPHNHPRIQMMRRQRRRRPPTELTQHPKQISHLPIRPIIQRHQRHQHHPTTTSTTNMISHPRNVIYRYKFNNKWDGICIYNPIIHCVSYKNKWRIISITY